MSDRLTTSNALHQRVRSFISESVAGTPRESFDDLACDIATFQAKAVTPVSRLWRSLGLHEVTAASEIPAMPCDAFRLRRVAAHPTEADARCFLTSGTTTGARGQHAMRTTTTYELAALTWAQRMLFPEQIPQLPHQQGALPGSMHMPMIVLASSEEIAPESSLTFMLSRFAEALGGDATWHYDGERVDIDGVVTRAQAARSPVLLAGTSFAFVHLLDALGEKRLPLPEGSRIMQTGGFKGRSRTVSAPELRAMLATCFGIAQDHVIGEYGMTELSSQLYQRGDVYFPPQWLRVTAVDPETLAPAISSGGPREGLARFVDLANVDSAVAIQTADRIVQYEDGSIALRGRAPGATPRGCSLAMEHLLEP